MKIGMCDLVIFRLVWVLQGFNTLRFITSHDVTSGHVYMEMYGDIGLSANKEACWSTFVFLAVIYTYGHQQHLL